jgi:hypothetical protein
MKWEGFANVRDQPRRTADSVIEKDIIEASRSSGWFRWLFFLLVIEQHLVGT